MDFPKVRLATSGYKMTKGVNKFSFSFARNLLAFETVGKNREFIPDNKAK
jgi:hypothetical protein